MPTYARLPSALSRIRRGLAPTVTFFVTVFVAVSITATVFEPPMPVSPPVAVAYTVDPSGETTTSCG